MILTGTLSASEERVQVALEELQDLKGVWCELSKIWEQIDEMKDKPWLSVAPRKVGGRQRECHAIQVVQFRGNFDIYVSLLR